MSLHKLMTTSARLCQRVTASHLAASLRQFAPGVTSQSSSACWWGPVEPVARQFSTSCCISVYASGQQASIEQNTKDFRDEKEAKTYGEMLKTGRLEDNPERQKYVASCRDKMKPNPGTLYNPSLDDRLRWMKITKLDKAKMAEQPIWIGYRRNFKGQFAPAYPRTNCRRGSNIKHWHANPCPLCQMTSGTGKNEVKFTHVDTMLLNQFINEPSNEILATKITNVCKRQQIDIMAAIAKARDYGYLQHTLPLASEREMLELAPPNNPCGIPKGMKPKLSGMGKRMKMKIHKTGHHHPDPL